MIFGREPVVILGAVKAAVAMAIAVGWLELTQDEVGFVMGAVAALLGLAVAYFTRDMTLGVVSGVIEALVALAVAFGLSISPEATASILALVAAVFAFFGRTQTSPERGWSAGA